MVSDHANLKTRTQEPECQPVQNQVPKQIWSLHCNLAPTTIRRHFNSYPKPRAGPTHKRFKLLMREPKPKMDNVKFQFVVTFYNFYKLLWRCINSKPKRTFNSFTCIIFMQHINPVRGGSFEYISKLRNYMIISQIYLIVVKLKRPLKCTLVFDALRQSWDFFL